MPELSLLNILTFVWLGFWALLALRSLAHGNQNSILVLILVHFVFSGIPLILDLFIGQPDYDRFIGFRLAFNDKLTSVIYCFYVSYVPVLLWFFSRKGIEKKDVNTVTKRIIFSQDIALKLVTFFLLMLLVASPIITVAFAPNPEIYLDYGIVLNIKDIEMEKYHVYVELSTLLSVIGLVIILIMRSSIKLIYLIFLLPWWLIAVWINGKRYLIAFTVLLVGYVFWQKGYLYGKRLILSIIFSLIVIFGFSFTYESAVRDISLNSVDFSLFYETTRLDFGRDHTIKMAIFAELNPDQIKILDYRGESLLFNLTFYIPRANWSEKPLPYATYFTSAVFKEPATSYGWGFTTSILDEAIANFSWFGMILGPLFLIFICRVGDSCNNPIVKAFTILISCLFLTVHFDAFAPIFYIWVLLVKLISNSNKKQKIWKGKDI